MFNKISSAFREFGVFAGCIYLIDQAMSKISPHFRLYLYELMVQPIHDVRLVPERLAGGLELREVKRDSPVFDSLHTPRQIIDYRYDQDAICLGAYKDDRMIGYIWFSFGKYLEDEVRCTYLLHPESQSVFDFDLYLFPEYRFGFGFVSIWDAANKFLRQRGIRFTYSRLTRFNTASRRAHAHLGWRCLGRCLFLKIWGVEMLASTIAPYLHLSTRNRVKFVLRPDVLVAENSYQQET